MMSKVIIKISVETSVCTHWGCLFLSIRKHYDFFEHWVQTGSSYDWCAECYLQWCYLKWAKQLAGVVTKCCLFVTSYIPTRTDSEKSDRQQMMWTTEESKPCVLFLAEMIYRIVDWQKNSRLFGNQLINYLIFQWQILNWELRWNWNLSVLENQLDKTSNLMIGFTLGFRKLWKVFSDIL